MGIAGSGADLVAPSGGSELKRYPGQRNEALRQCLRQSQLGEEQVVRLMLQELRDRGFTDSYKLLQRESGYTLEDEPVACFRSNALSGKWSEVENALPSIGIDTSDNVSVRTGLINLQRRPLTTPEPANTCHR
ncbi:hypothetical protein GGH92_010972 [Coemansia sp. RSA 2673]|nr:hypothetical protein GGH92_010972 [Coemansia sp. RSA 2673]